MQLSQAIKVFSQFNLISKVLIPIASSMEIRFHKLRFFSISIESALVPITSSLLLFQEPSQEKRFSRQLSIGISGKMNFISRNNLIKSNKCKKGKKKSKKNQKNTSEKKKKSWSNYTESLKRVKKWENKRWSKNRKIRYNLSER